MLRRGRGGVSRKRKSREAAQEKNNPICVSQNAKGGPENRVLVRSGWQEEGTRPKRIRDSVLAPKERSGADTYRKGKEVPTQRKKKKNLRAQKSRPDDVLSGLGTTLSQRKRRRIVWRCALSSREGGKCCLSQCGRGGARKTCCTCTGFILQEKLVRLIFLSVRRGDRRPPTQKDRGTSVESGATGHNGRRQFSCKRRLGGAKRGRRREQPEVAVKIKVIKDIKERSNFIEKKGHNVQKKLGKNDVVEALTESINRKKRQRAPLEFLT